MADVEGLSPEELEAQGATVEAVVAAALALVAEQTAASVLAGIPAVIGTGLPAYPWVSLDDVAIIPSLWLRQLDEQVMPAVRAVFDQTQGHVHAQIQAAVNGDPTLYGTPEFDLPGEAPPVVVPDIPDVTTEQLMTAARNRLVGIGDTLWADVRQQIVEGIGLGESIEQLGKRIEATAGVAEPRARTIARTEVVSVSNGAAIAQARSAGVPMRKIWLATEDIRTRFWHVEADGIMVALDGTFTVGPDELDFPGDPTGSPSNVINCFPSWQPLSVTATALMKRRFQGMLVHIITTGGHELSATPNHPVLTRRGWLALAAIEPGDQVLCCTQPGATAGPIHPDVTNGEIAADQIARSIEFAVGRREGMAATLVDLNGDIIDEYVDVIRTDLPLSFGTHTEQLHELRHLSVHRRRHRQMAGLHSTALDHLISKSDLVCLRDRPSWQSEILQDTKNPISGDSQVVSNAENGCLLSVETPDRLVILLPTCECGERGESSVLECLGHHPFGDVQSPRYFGDREHPLLVEDADLIGQLDTIVRPWAPGSWHVISSRSEQWYDGIVYDFESPAGLISAGGIVTGNCRCGIGFELGVPEPVVAAVGRKTAADPYVRDNQGQFAEQGTRDLSKLKVPELRAEVKKRGLKGLSKATKPQLIEALQRADKQDAPPPVERTVQPPKPRSSRAKTSAPRAAAVPKSPDVLAAEEHARSLVKDLPAGLRKEVLDSLLVQAALKPRSVRTLKGFGLTDLGNAGAQYFPGSRSIDLNSRWKTNKRQLNAAGRASLDDGYLTPTGSPSVLGAYVAHEFGHHVAFGRYDPKAPGMPKAFADRLFGALSAAAGTSPPKSSRAIMPWRDIESWMSANRKKLSNSVSEYGSETIHELLAEIWQEYSTKGEAARPAAKAVGAVLQGAPITAAVGRRTAADPYIRDADGNLHTHLPGLHDQKDHGRRYGPGDVRPPRVRTPKAKAAPKQRKPRTPPEPPPLTPQQEAMLARREPTPLSTPEAVRAIYGARLRTDGSDLAEAAVAGLADIPDAIHRRVNAYMDAWSPSAGIYVTRGQMVDFVPELRAIANEHPRGYAEGKTWRDSGGLHSQSENLIAVGTPRGETGSEQRYYSTAQHEMGHALDSSMGFPSRQPQWREQVLKLADSPQLSVNPYYRADGNPYGWDSEAFAQALHGWANGLKQRREGARVYAMLDAFGFFRRDYTKYPYEQDFDPPLLEAAQHMIRFFDQAAGVN